VRPEQRRHGIGTRGGGRARLWLEIEPGNPASLELHTAPVTS
jgi:hypothetical protein